MPQTTALYNIFLKLFACYISYCIKKMLLLIFIYCVFVYVKYCLFYGEVHHRMLLCDYTMNHISGKLMIFCF